MFDVSMSFHTIGSYVIYYSKDVTLLTFSGHWNNYTVYMYTYHVYM